MDTRKKRVAEEDESQDTAGVEEESQDVKDGQGLAELTETADDESDDEASDDDEDEDSSDDDEDDEE